MELSIQQLEDINEKLKSSELTNFIQHLKDSHKEVATLGDMSKELGVKVLEAFRNMAVGAEKYAESIKKVIQSYKGVEEGAAKLAEELESSMKEVTGSEKMASDGLASLAIQGGAALLPLLSNIPESINGMGNLTAASYGAGFQISNSFKEVKPVLQAMNTGLANVIGRYGEGADKANIMQRSIVEMAAAQGNLNSMQDGGVLSSTKMNQAYLDMIELVYQSADATGQTVEAMQAFIPEFKSIPDAMSPIKIAGENMSQMAAASKLATAYGKDQASVAKQLAAVYTSVGLSGEKAFEAINSIYEKAGSSKLRMEAFSSTVMKIAGDFKLFGDNTTAAANIVKSFDTVFKDSKLSPDGIQDVVQGIASGIQGMSTATKAFVSSQSGGPGGIAGAVEMDWAIQNNKKRLWA